MLEFLFDCVGLLAAVLPAAPEPPVLLSTLANCAAAPACVREWCIIRLVNEHARDGMTLEQTARLLDRPTWLEKRGLNYSRMIVAGYIPVGVERGQTTIAVGVAVLSEDRRCTLWIRIAGQVDPEDLLHILKGGKSKSVENFALEAIKVTGIRF
jgi:hypothetical protein